MAATVHPINRNTRNTDVGRIKVAAAELRSTDRDQPAADLADLLDAVATAMRLRTDPPMTEAETWRWSGVVGAARRISGKRS